MLRYTALLMWALLLLPMAVQAEEFVFDRILVKINDDIITQYDLDKEMKPILAKVGDRQLAPAEQEQLDRMRKQILDRMVNDSLMNQEIRKFEITVSEDRIDDEIERVKREQGYTDEDFVETLKKDNLTLGEFRNKLKGIIEKQELLGYMVHSKVVVTDSEIETDYEANKADYTLNKMVALAIIILPSDVTAKEVTKRIEDGELTFAQAAEKYTVGPGKDEGGSIGEVAWDDLADEWREAIDGVEEGGVSSPIEVQGQQAVLSPVKIENDRMVPLEDVRDEIFKRLMTTKREAIFEEYFEKLKQKSVIIYMN